MILGQLRMRARQTKNAPLREEKLLGRKETLASKYRAAKTGHISAKGIGGGWIGKFSGLEPPTIGWFAPQKPDCKSCTQSVKGQWGAEWEKFFLHFWYFLVSSKKFISFAGDICHYEGFDLGGMNYFVSPVFVQNFDCDFFCVSLPHDGWPL